MNCTVFVTVRTASSRLPKKALLKINKKPLIKLLVDRIKTTQNISKVVVCTTTEESDNELTELLLKSQIDVFRGDNRDILNRLYLAAKKYQVKEFVVVEGDDVFCDPYLIQITCSMISKSDADFIIWKNVPFGTAPYGIKTAKLKLLIDKKGTKNTETGWGKFIIESGLLKVETIEPEDRKLIRPELRLTVDYKEDFELAKKIYENLHEDFSLKNIIELLDKNPQLVKINESINSKYQKNFENKRQRWVKR